MLTLQVTGMTCGSCVKTLEGALKGVRGVHDARVDFQAQTATIEGTPDVKDILATIHDEGYQAAVLASAR